VRSPPRPHAAGDEDGCCGHGRRRRGVAGATSCCGCGRPDLSTGCWTERTPDGGTHRGDLWPRAVDRTARAGVVAPGPLVRTGRRRRGRRTSGRLVRRDRPAGSGDLAGKRRQADEVRQAVLYVLLASRRPTSPTSGSSCGYCERMALAHGWVRSCGVVGVEGCAAGQVLNRAIRGQPRHAGGPRRGRADNKGCQTSLSTVD